ncbi:hypothetical protein [Crateriforma conspicua]|uniref:Uncharacterized protein n=1 Tax=Crateriforma conspicua TaxID=2527996 RepID=A0A5C5XZA4_9PLAN|nr:hypothetical protein [Crateriforma conspicua]QDV62995.1 hypothetical protein Mal65_21320 [Crateriforma conspicua]TWT68224.1 hypothetical protein Pan14r_04670 [Crateriforma conspicua]
MLKTTPSCKSLHWHCPWEDLLRHLRFFGILEMNMFRISFFASFFLAGMSCLSANQPSNVLEPRSRDSVQQRPWDELSHEFASRPSIVRVLASLEGVVPGLSLSAEQQTELKKLSARHGELMQRVIDDGQILSLGIEDEEGLKSEIRATTEESISDADDQILDWFEQNLKPAERELVLKEVVSYLGIASLEIEFVREQIGIDSEKKKTLAELSALDRKLRLLFSKVRRERPADFAAKEREFLQGRENVFLKLLTVIGPKSYLKFMELKGVFQNGDEAVAWISSLPTARRERMFEASAELELWWQNAIVEQD